MYIKFDLDCDALGDFMAAFCAVASPKTYALVTFVGPAGGNPLVRIHFATQTDRDAARSLLEHHDDWAVSSLGFDLPHIFNDN